MVSDSENCTHLLIMLGPEVVPWEDVVQAVLAFDQWDVATVVAKPLAAVSPRTAGYDMSTSCKAYKA